MKFDWTPRTIKEWNNFLQRAPLASWTLSWPHAQAAKKTDHFTTRIALLRNEEQQPIGMVAVQEIQFWIFQFINIKRGPVWFESSHHKTGAIQKQQLTQSFDQYSELEIEFAKELRKEFPRRLISRIRWTPSRPIDTQAIEHLARLDFQLTDQNFVTEIVDISCDLERIRSSLKQKWRNALNKAEASSLTIKTFNHQIEIRQKISMFCLQYEKFKAEKKFLGPTARFLFLELLQAALQKDCVLVFAEKDGIPVSAGAFTISGKTISYRAGWSSPRGRETNANYLVLWALIEWSKANPERYLEYFDLGGVLPDEAPGLTRFKSGLNGRRIELPTFR